MLVAEFTLEGISPYSQSKFLGERPADRDPGAWEKEVWKQRMHVDSDGYVVIPPMAVKYSMIEAARSSGDKIKGQRNATWTKQLVQGLLPVPSWYVLVGGDKYHIDNVQGEPLMLNADGKRGGSTRVERIMPYIPAGWTADVALHVTSPALIDNPDRVERYMEYAGQFIGIGRWRPEKGGIYGRFTVLHSKIEKLDALKAA